MGLDSAEAPKATLSLPLRPSPASPPPLNRPSSKSGPPVYLYEHSAAHSAHRRQQDALDSANSSRSPVTQRNSARYGSVRVRDMSGTEALSYVSSARPGQSEGKSGGSEAIARLLEQVGSQGAAVDGVDSNFGAEKSSVWSSPAPSPQPDGPGSATGHPQMDGDPSSTSAHQQTARPSLWSQGAATYDQQGSSTERPPHFRNPSTANSSATARQPRQPYGQAQQVGSPYPASEQSPYTFPATSYPSYSWGYPSPEQLMYESSPYSPPSAFGPSPTLQPMGSPMTGQPYFEGSPYPSYAAPMPFSLQQHQQQQQYYNPPSGRSSLSPSVQHSSGSIDFSSQPTTASAGVEGSSAEIVYGSDGSPVKSQEMLQMAQSQHYAAMQQQQQLSPYVSYVPATFSNPEAATYAYNPAFGSPTFASPSLPDFSNFQYPISSHSAPQSQPPQSFPAPSSPYAMAAPLPPPPPPHLGHAQPPYPTPYRYYPPAPLAYAGYPPVPPPSFVAPNMSPPQVYAPPPELARGQLAQSKFHEAVYGLERDGSQPTGARDGRRGSGTGAMGGAGFGGRALPKPPAHSPHALWVGNVPSDATHPELWRFFAARPVPASSPKYANLHPSEIPPGVDLNSTGIESIHLISRSNCAFVNYASDIHLQHSIAVSNGLPLRPHDPRCKDLVCRVRKRDEDAKSGVGAQRTGGMHRDFVREKEREKREAEKRAAEETEGGNGEADGEGKTAHRYSTGSTARSISTASTTSSFLTKHFEKRYFILKAHDEHDLKLSVERGLWMTQLHNEPVLDQAFKTAKDVFLIFGANKAGAFAGYARMTSAIRQVSNSSSSGEHRISGSSSDEPQDSISSSQYSSGRPATIHEEKDIDGSDYPRLFSPSEHRLALTSPLPLTPGGTRVATSSAPATLTPGARAKFEEEADRVAASDVANTLAKLHLPDDAATRGESLDPKVLARRDGAAGVPPAVAQQQALGSSDMPGKTDEDGVWRKDQLLTAAERNARLEKMEENLSPAEKESKQSSNGWGKPFEVQWIKVSRLPFARTRRIFNQFNAGREVKISRDGTELEPSAGEALIAEFWREEGQALNGDASPNGLGFETAESTSVQPSGLVQAGSSGDEA